MKKIIFFIIALYNYLHCMDLAPTPFHSLAFDNFEEIIRYSSEKTLHAMNCVCKSLSVFTLPLINKYAHYNYLTFLVDAARSNDDEKIKELIKEFYEWGYEDVLDWMPRILPEVKLSADSGLEMYLARGNRSWAQKQSKGDQETIAERRNHYLSCLGKHIEKIKSFYKDTCCIVNYYEKVNPESNYKGNFESCYYASPTHHALYKSIEESNIFITKLIIVQNKNIVNTAVTAKYISYPIHFAVENNKIDIVRVLLPVCDINMQNYIGNTPLMLAVCNRSIDIIKLLLQYKPNISITDKYRSNAIEYAPTEEIKELLFTALAESKSLRNQ